MQRRRRPRQRNQRLTAPEGRVDAPVAPDLVRPVRRVSAATRKERASSVPGRRAQRVLAVLTALVAPPLVLLPVTSHPHRPSSVQLAAGARAVLEAETGDGAVVAGEQRPAGDVVVHAPGAQVLQPQPGWLRLLSTRSISVDLGAWEPTIGIDVDGSVYAQLFGDDGVPSVGRSVDDGRTWTVVRPELQLTDVDGSQDPYLHLDRDTGRLFTANLLFPGHPPCHEIQYTDDGGTTWTSTAMCGEMDHQTLFTGPPVRSEPTGYPNLVYYCAANNGGGATFSVHTSCFVSRDGGLTFAPTGDQPFVGIDPEVEQGQFGIPGFCDGLTGHGVVGADGAVYLPRIHCDRPMLAISRDEGLTWERVQVGPPGTGITNYGYHSHDAGVAVHDDGTLSYTWVGRDRLPYLVTSTDGGHTWTPPVMIGHPDVVETSLPGAIEVVGPGRVAVAYVGSEDSPGPPFPEVLDCTPDVPGCVDRSPQGTRGDPPSYDGVTWHGYVTVIDGVATERPLLFSARVTASERPLVTGTCGPHRCKGLADFMDVAVAPDGAIWGVFVDECAHDADGPGGRDGCQDLYGRLQLGVLEGRIPGRRPGGDVGIHAGA